MAISIEEFEALKVGDDVRLCRRYPTRFNRAGRVVRLTKTGKVVKCLGTDIEYLFYSPTRVRGERFHNGPFLGTDKDWRDISVEIIDRNARHAFREARDEFAKIHPDRSRSELLAELKKVREKILAIPENNS